MGGLTRRHGERCDRGWWLSSLFLTAEPRRHLTHGTTTSGLGGPRAGSNDGSGVTFARARETGQSQQSIDRFVSPRGASPFACVRRRDAGSYVRRALHSRYAGCARATRREGWRSGHTIRRLACSRLTSMPRTRANCAYHDSVSGTIWRRSEQFGVRIKFLWITRVCNSGCRRTLTRDVVF